MTRPLSSLLVQSRAMQRIRPTHSIRQVVLVALAVCVMIILGLLFIPWQQSISGKGKVSVFQPMNRPQNIETQISGRIVRWHIQEGQMVSAGQVLVELAETDPKYLSPAQAQQLQNQRSALLARQSATQHRIASLEQQVRFLTQSQGVAISSATVKAQQARNRIMAAEQGLKAAQQNQQTAKLNEDRLLSLHAQGLRSTRDKELAILASIEATTKVRQAETALQVAQQDLSVAGFDQTRVLPDTSASLSTAQAGIASAYESLASIQSDLAKLSVDLAGFDQRVAQRTLKAPKAGRVVRINNPGVNETVSEGDALAILLPVAQNVSASVRDHSSAQQPVHPVLAKEDQAVELIVSDNDAPLVAVGRMVRLQFAGWPALQFSGWPSIATGTFSGRVKVIDAVDNGTSQYRIWVEPDWDGIESGREQPWPTSRFLRPGSQAVGWVMLDTVPLWWELWRQFNAFPPTVSLKGDANADSKAEKSSEGSPKPDIKKPKKKK